MHKSARAAALGGVYVERDVPAQMRDGTVLYADVYRPDASGDYPVLLLRGPYDKNVAQAVVYEHPAWYARHGYIVVIQDVRGRFASDGEFDPLRYEAEDGFDTVQWASQLPGANGKVAACLVLRVELARSHEPADVFAGTLWAKSLRNKNRLPIRAMRSRLPTGF